MKIKAAKNIITLKLAMAGFGCSPLLKTQEDK